MEATPWSALLGLVLQVVHRSVARGLVDHWVSSIGLAVELCQMDWRHPSSRFALLEELCRCHLSLGHALEGPRWWLYCSSRLTSPCW